MQNPIETENQSSQKLPRKYIPSQIIKDKSKTLYIIDFNNVNIQIEESNNKIGPLIVYINGSGIAYVERKKKFEYDFESSIGRHKLIIYNSTRKNYFFTNIIIKNGISITIDNVAVQNTLADPLVGLREGKVSLWFFFVIFLSKIAFSTFAPEIQIPIILFYSIEALILLFCGIKFKTNPKKVLLIGLNLRNY